MILSVYQLLQSVHTVSLKMDNRVGCLEAEFLNMNSRISVIQKQQCSKQTCKSDILETFEEKLSDLKHQTLLEIESQKLSNSTVLKDLNTTVDNAKLAILSQIDHLEFTFENNIGRVEQTVEGIKDTDKPGTEEKVKIQRYSELIHLKSLLNET